MKKRSAPGKERIARTTDLSSIGEIETELQAIEAIRAARGARLEALGLTAPRPFVEVLRLARAIRAFQVAA